MARSRKVRPSLRIDLEIPHYVRDGFPQFLDKVQKNIVRQSIRSALIPAKNKVKAMFLQLAQDRRQASGATSRSIDSKAKSVRNEPFKFYGLVGVNRKYMEVFDPNTPSIFKGSLMWQASLGIKTRLRNGGRGFSKKFPRQQVKSYLKRRYGVLGDSKDAWSRRKRKPSRYLHLVENGFRGPGRRFFAGHKIVAKAINETKSEVRFIFEQKIVHHFRKAFHR